MPEAGDSRAVRPRPAPRNECSSRPCAIRHAGGKAESIAAIATAIVVNSKARPSTWIRCAWTRLSGASPTRMRTAARASRTPVTPPPAASTPPSISNWRVSRKRDAPSATRTAISRSRTAARASIRFATFAHAISKTNPTAPRSRTIIRRNGPVTCVASGWRPRHSRDWNPGTAPPAPTRSAPPPPAPVGP